MKLEIVFVLNHGPHGEPKECEITEYGFVMAEHLARSISFVYPSALRQATVLCSTADRTFFSARAIKPDRRPIALQSLFSNRLCANAERALRDFEHYIDNESLLIVTHKEMANFLGAELARRFIGLEKFTQRALGFFEGYVIDVKNGTLSFIDASWPKRRFMPA